MKSEDILASFNFQQSGLAQALSWRLKHDHELLKPTRYDIFATFHDSFVDDSNIISLVSRNRMGECIARHINQQNWIKYDRNSITSRSSRRSIITKHVNNIIKTVKDMYFYNDHLGGFHVSADQLCAIQFIEAHLGLLINNGRLKDAAVFASAVAVIAFTRVTLDVLETLVEPEFAYDHIEQNSNEYLRYKVGLRALLQSTMTTVGNTSFGDYF